jgi:ribosomal protein L22
MEFRAEARFMRVSPQKARLVLNLIKGRRVEEARTLVDLWHTNAVPCRGREGNDEQGRLFSAAS